MPSDDQSTRNESRKQGRSRNRSGVCNGAPALWFRVARVATDPHRPPRTLFAPLSGLAPVDVAVARTFLMSNPSKHASRGGKPLRGHPKDSPEVRLSKTLSWILRHGAKSEGLYMRPDGYVRVSDLVRVTFRSGKVYGNLLRRRIVTASFTQVVLAYSTRPCGPATHSRE